MFRTSWSNGGRQRLRADWWSSFAAKPHRGVCVALARIAGRGRLRCIHFRLVKEVFKNTKSIFWQNRAPLFLERWLRPNGESPEAQRSADYSLQVVPWSARPLGLEEVLGDDAKECSKVVCVAAFGAERGGGLKFRR